MTFGRAMGTLPQCGPILCQNHMFCISNPQALKSGGWVADTNFAARARSHNGVDRGWVEQLNLLL